MTVDKAETLETSRVRTLETLAALEAHWSATEVAVVRARILADSGSLAEDGDRWNAACGHHILPALGLGLRDPQAEHGPPWSQRQRGPGPRGAPLLVALALCGHGVFATVPLAKGTKLGEFLGQASRSYDVWCEEMREFKRVARGAGAVVPCIPEQLYATCTGSGPVDAGVVVGTIRVGNMVRFINCCCEPDTAFTASGRGYRKHSWVVISTRDSTPWEFLQLRLVLGRCHARGLRVKALGAYNRDLAELRVLGAWACGRQVSAAQVERVLEAFRVGESLVEFAAAWEEARRLPRFLKEPPAFLQRFPDLEEVATFLEQGLRDLAEAGGPLYRGRRS